jgi:hypothetical protein
LLARVLRGSGMIGMTLLNPLACVLAMNYASPSILAPFSGLTLVWIVLLSNPIIGEQPTLPHARMIYSERKETYALAVDPVQGTTITFMSDYDYPVPLALGYAGQGSPDIYPTVEVTLNNSGDPLQVNPDITRGTRGNQRKPSTANLNSYMSIGNAMPGQNTIVIQPLEKTQDRFEVVSVYLCGACLEFQNGHMGWGDLVTDNAGVPFDKQAMKDKLGYEY